MSPKTLDYFFTVAHAAERGLMWSSVQEAVRGIDRELDYHLQVHNFIRAAQHYREIRHTLAKQLPPQPNSTA